MQNLDPTIYVVAGLSATLSGFERIVGNPEVRRSVGFENRPLECNHAASFNPKLLKPLVQDRRDSAEKFENRLLGPTNKFHPFVSQMSSRERGERPRMTYTVFCRHSSPFIGGAHWIRAGRTRR